MEELSELEDEGALEGVGEGLVGWRSQWKGLWEWVQLGELTLENDYFIMSFNICLMLLHACNVFFIPHLNLLISW